MLSKSARDWFYYHLNPFWIAGKIGYRVRVWKAEREIRPGDIYEDCRYHPMVCISNIEDNLTGVSMVTGAIGCCSQSSCGVIKFKNYSEAQKAATKLIEETDAIEEREKFHRKMAGLQ